MGSHSENSGACLDCTTIVSEARTVARPTVSAAGHPVNSGTCLDTTASVSAVKQSSILLKNSEDSEESVHPAQKRETRQNYVDAQAVKTSVIVAEIVRNHTGPRISSCAKLSNL